MRNKLIEEEGRLLKKWPKLDTGFNRNIYEWIASDLLDSIRKRSIQEGIPPQEHGDRVVIAREILDDIHEWISNAHGIEETKNYDFWSHKSVGGPSISNMSNTNHNFPLNRYDLCNHIRRYLQHPYMQTDEIDQRLTDLLLYAELLSLAKSISFRKAMMAPTNYEIAITYTLKLLKWTLIAFLLIATYKISREMFTLFGVALIAHKSVAKITEKQTIPEERYHNQAWVIYNHSDQAVYNASTIYDLCLTMRRDGTYYDGILFDLLLRQIGRKQTPNPY